MLRRRRRKTDGWTTMGHFVVTTFVKRWAMRTCQFSRHRYDQMPHEVLKSSKVPRKGYTHRSQTKTCYLKED